MKKIEFFVVTYSVIIILLIFNTQSFAQEIDIFGNESKPPKYYLENGKAQGILVDIMKYVDAELESSFIIKLYPWKRAYQYALEGKGGIIGISMNNERLEKFDYSDVMYSDTLVFVVLKGNEFSYNHVNDLEGKIIGVQRGSSYGEEFEKFKIKLKLDEDGSGEQRLLKLLYNRIDVALIGPGKDGVKSIIKRNKELTRRKDKFVIISQPFNRDPNYLAFSKTMNMKGFLLEFNQILKKGYESGSIQKIVNEYSN